MTTLNTYSPTPTYTVGHYSNNDRLPALFHDRWLNTVLEGLDGWTKAFDIPNTSYPYNVKTARDKDGNVSEYSLEVALAGVGKDNIAVKVKEDRLLVDIESKHTEPESVTDELGSTVSYVKRGISKRKGQLSFVLGDHVNLKKIESTYIDGLLKIVIPITKPETINIDVKVK